MTAQRTTPKGKTLTAPAALAESPLELFSTVYRGCAVLGIPKGEVDEMEVWEVASTLGVDMDDGSTSTPGSSGAPPPPGSLSRGRRRGR